MKKYKPTIKLDDEMARMFDTLCVAEDRSVAYILTKLIQEYTPVHLKRWREKSEKKIPHAQKIPTNK